MKRAFILRCTVLTALTGMLSSCGGRYADTGYRDTLQNPLTGSPLIRDYKSETQDFIARLKNTGKVGDVKAWAIQLLQAHMNDNATFTVPHTELPDFILKLDPPLEPSRVIVVPKSHVTIAWGGGFGWWGLFLSDHEIALENPAVYVIKWVPGVEVFHDIQ